MLDSPLLGRPAPVVRNRRHVADRTDLQPGARERLNRGLAARAGTLHAHVHALHAEVQRFPRRLLSRHRRGEGRRFLGALEAGLARRAPRDRVALQIGDRNERVVERRGHVRYALSFDDLLGALSSAGGANRRRLRVRFCLGLCVGFGFCFRFWFGVRHVPYFLRTGFFLPAIARRGPFFVRALVCVRWPRTGRFLRWRPPRYVPMSINRLMFIATSVRNAPSTL